MKHIKIIITNFIQYLQYIICEELILKLDWLLPGYFIYQVSLINRLHYDYI